MFRFLFVSRRPLSTPVNTEAPLFPLGSEWNQASHGRMSAVDIVPGIVTVGTDSGSLHVFTYGDGKHVRPYLTIPPPPSNDVSIVLCKISAGKDKICVFVAYNRGKRDNHNSKVGTNAGISCYEMPAPFGAYPAAISAPSARHDLDGRNVLSSSLCDAVINEKDGSVQIITGRHDGLYFYSSTQKVNLS